MFRTSLVIAFLCLFLAGSPQASALTRDDPDFDRPVALAIEQLRHIVGNWKVETDFFGPDSKLLGTYTGRYEFRWVVEDKIVSGHSELPQLQQKSAILFFHRLNTREVEMISVGSDGRPWRMIGPDDSEVRTTANTPMPNGTKLMLRFTRHNIEQDSFQSTMESSDDGGKTWHLGNRQRFKRMH